MRQSVFVVPAVVEVAERRGLFDAFGVQVQTLTVGSSHEQRSHLDDRRAEVAITASDNLFAWNADGSDIAVIGQIETTTDLALMVRSGLATLHDARPIRLAVDAPTNGFAIVAYSMLAAAAVDRAAYEIIEIGGARERFDALAAGIADATLLAPPLDEIARARGMTVAMRVGDLTPSYPGLGIVADRRVIDGAGDEIARYLRALAAAHAWMRDAPSRAVEQLLLDAGLGRAAIASAISTVPDSLRPSSAGLQTLARVRASMNMSIDGAPDPDDIVDLRPLRTASLIA